MITVRDWIVSSIILIPHFGVFQNKTILKKQLAESQNALEKNCQMMEMLKTKAEEGLEA